jgi:DNA-directed RNA polymerase alpha subunit
MSAKLTNFHEDDDVLTFTLSNIDVCYANAIRRTILSEIPIVVFKSTPYEENKINIITNTTRLNNELIKQRLSCIPIHIQDLNTSLQNYLLELDVENNTDTIMIVTSKDFKIKNLTTNTYLQDSDLRQIFPPYIPSTGKDEYFIDFVKLRPRLSEQLLGEKINLTAQFDISNAKENSMFNVVGTCSYGFTPDDEEIQKQLQIRKQKWSDEGKNDEEIDFEAKNWVLLEGLRYVKKYSFDFIIQTVGIYENVDIIKKACIILDNKLSNLKTLIEEDKIEIEKSNNTLDNCYDIILENEDYTLGNIINYELYEIFYKNYKILKYVGFKKLHPHDTSSIIRLSFIDSENISKSKIKQILIECIEQSNKIINSIKGCFDGSRKK